ncbi:formate--tetrahydrofolate ligase [Candidatus Micrarchaeota archaeon]|nr:formate--tetrahydrofolate ligase [Candidatus Micrarchaeota archaeon]
MFEYMSSMKNIKNIAEKTGILETEIEQHGQFIAKVSLNLLDRLKNKKDGKLIPVTAMTPTKTGEGKTTTSIGLSEALNQLERKTIVCLREPSLGPFFGVKGGASGGGKCKVEPSQEIDLHFTGDLHAITSAHNLLSAMLDNHLFHGNELEIDKKKIVWPRALDMNDRALREVQVGKWGKKARETKREEKFVITAASELMAILCLSENEKELKERIAKIIVAYNKKGKPVTARELKADGAMMLLLKHALKPNLVQTTEETPAFVHGGPFANVAHGTNSILATRMALKLAGENGFVVIESGFGSELGAEKFIDIVSRMKGLKPRIGVIIATVKAIERQGNGKLEDGLENLWKHAENIEKLGLTPIIALNKFNEDDEKKLEEVKKECEKKAIRTAISKCYSEGGRGAIELAKLVIQASEEAEKRNNETKQPQQKPRKTPNKNTRAQQTKPTSKSEKQTLTPRYQLEQPIKQKIEIIAREMYGAGKVNYSKQAGEEIKRISKLGYSKLPICMAKTQMSLSDDAEKLGAPTNFKITVQEVKILAGAGFILATLGEINLMPGLPKQPAAERM